MRAGSQLILAVAVVASTGTKNGAAAEPTSPGAFAYHLTAVPVVFAYDRKAVPTGPRELTYDPKGQEYHLLVYCRAHLEVKAVAPDLGKGPVVLRVEGLSDHPDGPLQLLVDGKV